MAEYFGPVKVLSDSTYVYNREEEMELILGVVLPLLTKSKDSQLAQQLLQQVSFDISSLYPSTLNLLYLLSRNNDLFSIESYPVVLLIRLFRFGIRGSSQLILWSNS